MQNSYNEARPLHISLINYRFTLCLFSGKQMQARKPHKVIIFIAKLILSLLSNSGDLNILMSTWCTHKTLSIDLC